MRAINTIERATYLMSKADKDLAYLQLYPLYGHWRGVLFLFYFLFLFLFLPISSYFVCSLDSTGDKMCVTTLHLHCLYLYD